jgi:glucoselysine-6-phosphate deglycase
MKKTMADYISEIPEVIKENIKNAKSMTKPLVDEFLKKPFNRIWIVGSGSSYNGALCSRDFVREVLDVDVKVIPPASFMFFENDLKEDDFVFVVSQTGYSTNALLALNLIKSKGLKTIGVTGDIESDFKTVCDLVVDYGMGIETVHYVTKGVTTFVAFLVAFACESAKALGKMTDADVASCYQSVNQIMDQHPKIIADTNSWIDKNIKDFSSMQTLFLCSYGSNYGTIYEGSLKISETVHIPAFPLEAEEFIHGPFLQVNPNYSLLFLDTGAQGSDRLRDIYTASKMMTDHTFLVTDKAMPNDDKVLQVMKTPNQLLNPLIYLPVVQTIAFRASTYPERFQHPLLEGFKKAILSKSPNYKED